MFDVIKRFILNALRIFAIVFVITICVTGLTKCGTESETESVTVLSLDTSTVVEEHIDDVPVKTIVSSSNVDENVDIVLFGTPESFEKYSGEFEFLETVSTYSSIPFALYTPYACTCTKLNFNDIIDGIIERKPWNSLCPHADEDVIELNYDLSGDEAYAFYTLLFNYFSEGKPSEKLSDNEREDVINKVKNFIIEHPSVNNRKVATFNSVIGDNEDYNTVKLNQKVAIERTFGVVTENGRKYLNEVMDQCVDDDELVVLGLVYCESIDLINNFIETNVADFTYNSEMLGKVGEIIVKIIVKIIWLIIACCIFLGEGLYVGMDDWEIWEWSQIDTLCGSLVTGLFLIFESYLVTIIVSIAWLIWLLIYDDWFYDFSYEFSDYFEAFRETISEWRTERKNEKEQKAKALEKAKAVVDQLGEENSSEFLKLQDSLNEMTKFNEELGIKTDVWKNIREFIDVCPSSFSLMNGLIDNKVIYMLNAYRELPRDENGKLISNFDLNDRIKTILINLNEVVKKNFDEKKDIYNMDTKAWLKLAEAELKNEMNIE